MAIIGRTCDSVSDFGMIASAETREFGFGSTNLVQRSNRGKLAKVTCGVYRMPVWLQQEAAPYALAVKAARAESESTSPDSKTAITLFT